MLFTSTLAPLALLAASFAPSLAAPAAHESSLSIESRTSSKTFHPSDYKKKFVTCNAVDRSGTEPKNIKLKLAYLDINPKASKTLVMVHGWPSLWTTYRHQIEAFGKDYRLIIPEHRGFGDSEHPKDLESSNTLPDV